MEPSMGDINKPAINHVVFLNALNSIAPPGVCKSFTIFILEKCHTYGIRLSQ